MENITVLTWPKLGTPKLGTPSLLAQMLRICLGPDWVAALAKGRTLAKPEVWAKVQTGAASAGTGTPGTPSGNTPARPPKRRFVVEYQDFPQAVVQRFEAAVVRGSPDTAEAFRRFVRQDAARYKAFCALWVHGAAMAGQVVVKTADLRADPAACLTRALAVLVPDAPPSPARIARAVQHAEREIAARPLPDLPAFRYYDAALFRRLAVLHAPRKRLATPAETRPAGQTPLPPSAAPKAPAPVSAPVSAEEITLAYRLFLGRTPSETETRRHLTRPKQIGAKQMRPPGLEQLRRGFLDSPEFAQVYKRLGRAAAVDPAAGPPPTLIHLHVPKTAGTSLNEILKSSFSAAETLDVQSETLDRLQTIAFEDRRALRVLKGHLQHGVAKLLPQPAIYLCLLRPPGPRLFSFYNFIRRRPQHPLHAQVTGQEMSFGGFLAFAAGQPMIRNELDSGQMRRIAGRLSPTFFGQEARIFQQAIVNIFAPDMIYGLTDQFEPFLDTLKDRGLIGRAAPVQMNVAPTSGDLDAALLTLTTEHRLLYDSFIKWDTWFYDICETAYFTHRLIKDAHT